MASKFLYIVLGLGAGRSMECITVERYEIARETPKRWYVKQRGSEHWFSKDKGWQFTDLDVMTEKLKQLKQRRLEEARRVVEKLEGETTIRFHDIPPTAPVSEDIKL